MNKASGNRIGANTWTLCVRYVHLLVLVYEFYDDVWRLMVASV